MSNFSNAAEMFFPHLKKMKQENEELRQKIQDLHFRLTWLEGYVVGMKSKKGKENE